MKVTIEVTQDELEHLKRLLFVKVQMIQAKADVADIQDRIIYRILDAAGMIKKETNDKP